LFTFKEDELWTLVDKGVLAYFGEYHFIFINETKESRSLVLYEHMDEDMEVYHHFEKYFEVLEVIK